MFDVYWDDRLKNFHKATDIAGKEYKSLTDKEKEALYFSYRIAIGV